MAQYAANHTRTLGQTPTLYAKRIRLFYLIKHNIQDQRFAPRPKDTTIKVLLKDTSVTTEDWNPHSADQKHKSLNLCSYRLSYDMLQHVQSQTDKI